MLRAWTRRGQIEMIGELKLLAHQAGMLASQERATARAARPAGRVHELLSGSEPILAKLEQDLVSGTFPSTSRRDLSFLYSIVVRETARADAYRHGYSR